MDFNFFSYRKSKVTRLFGVNIMGGRHSVATREITPIFYILSILAFWNSRMFASASYGAQYRVESHLGVISIRCSVTLIQPQWRSIMSLNLVIILMSFLAFRRAWGLYWPHLLSNYAPLARPLHVPPPYDANLRPPIFYVLVGHIFHIRYQLLFFLRFL